MTRLKALLIAVLLVFGFGAVLVSVASAASATRVPCNDISVSFKVTSSGTLDCFNDQNNGIHLPASVSYSTPTPWNVAIAYYPCSNYTQNVNCALVGARSVCLHSGYNNKTFQSALGLSQIDIIQESIGIC